MEAYLFKADSIDYIILAGAKELFNNLTYSRSPYGNCKDIDQTLEYLDSVVKQIQEKING